MVFSKDEAAVETLVPERKTQPIPPCKGQAACLAASVQLMPKSNSEQCATPFNLGGELLPLILK